MKRNSRIIIPLVLSSLLLCGGCASVASEVKSVPAPQIATETPAPKVSGKKKLIAIIGFENKSTYSADKLWDTSAQLLFSNLLEIGHFRVVEWERMKQLFDWEELSTSSLVKVPEKRSKASKILLCEYFVNGTVTFFDVSQKAKVSAMSKSKTIETTIRVDLFMQDAQSGEYVAAAKGEAMERQEYEAGMLGGGTGTWDPKSADRALNSAINDAALKLTKAYYRHEQENR
jgi:curli biogenesis system outer membrane secretion channel CsgG